MPQKLPSAALNSPQTPDFAWINRISTLLDSRFTVPGTNWKFGLDPIIGLVPFAGDAASLMISGSLVMYMAKHGASKKLIILMAVNLLIDAIFGSIPVLGSIFDFYYKANDRNVRLMKRYYTEGKYRGSGTGIVVGVAVFLLLLLAAMVFGAIKLGEYISSQF